MTYDPKNPGDFDDYARDRKPEPAGPSLHQRREQAERFNRDVFAATQACWEAIERGERPADVVRGVPVGAIASSIYRAREVIGESSARAEQSAVRAWCAEMIWPAHFPAEKFPRELWYRQENANSDAF